MAAATEAFVESDAKTIKQSFSRDFGLENIDAKYKLIEGLVEKWKDLTRDAYDDKEAMTELLWTEVFSKIDPETYGMN